MLRAELGAGLGPPLSISISHPFGAHTVHMGRGEGTGVGVGVRVGGGMKPVLDIHDLTGNKK